MTDYVTMRMSSDDMSAEEFVERLRQTGFSPQELGDFLRVGRATVEHWLAGKSSPYRGMRRLYAAALPTVLDRIARELEKPQNGNPSS